MIYGWSVLKTLDCVSLASCCSKLSPKQQIQKPKEANTKTKMAILVLFILETETAMHGNEHVEEKKYSEV